MYRFPLESVLIHRQFIVETLQKDLAETEIRLFLEKRTLGELEKKASDCARELDRQREKEMSPLENRLYIDYLERLAGDARRQAKRIASLEKERDAKRDALGEAMKKQKTMERLKEKGRIEYEREETGRERAAMSEVAVNRFALRKHIGSTKTKSAKKTIHGLVESNCGGRPDQ